MWFSPHAQADGSQVLGLGSVGNAGCEASGPGFKPALPLAVMVPRGLL